MFLQCANRNQWRKLSEHLHLTRDTVDSITRNLADDIHKDNIALLLVLACWRERAPREGDTNKRATYTNLLKAVKSAGFTDFIGALDRMKQRWVLRQVFCV